ncbi:MULTISPECIES: acyl carrier protein [Lentzea]|jgi:acyl carrier protein|uniref:Acyl carrier protein n=1 Tax=Lentzea flaviverrucosa TaxID=200379 RepID=A0A1H9BX54_9PSEU|nr:MULTISPECIES: acyl carrier protein [Lentzea]MCR3754193.1 Acyl carrier protein [Lentzea californiensis]MCX2953670.1 acyl carrier protein [Lentzea sp. NEAU-D7]RDI31658.1 acyl carrier protein [Lentzea flaviverrucosa]SEP92948.1 Acyl carrier protein [Lentzea flaviverrucosa]
MSNDARTQIRTFITTKFPDVTFSDEEDIFALGFVNSLFAMELVMFIEKAFGTRIPNEELHLGNFRSVALMADLVARQTSAAVG